MSYVILISCHDVELRKRLAWFCFASSISCVSTRLSRLARAAISPIVTFSPVSTIVISVFISSCEECMLKHGRFAFVDTRHTISCCSTILSWEQWYAETVTTCIKKRKHALCAVRRARAAILSQQPVVNHCSQPALQLHTNNYEDCQTKQKGDKEALWMEIMQLACPLLLLSLTRSARSGGVSFCSGKRLATSALLPSYSHTISAVAICFSNFDCFHDN